MGEFLSLIMSSISLTRALIMKRFLYDSLDESIKMTNKNSKAKYYIPYYSITN